MWRDMEERERAGERKGGREGWKGIERWTERKGRNRK
jgi:hypothetical protein